MPHHNRSTVIVLSSLLFINPVAFYILTDSVLWTFLVTFIVPISLFLLWIHCDKHRWIFYYVFNFFIVISLFINAETIFRCNFSEYIVNNLYDMQNGYYFNKPNMEHILEDKEYVATYRTNIDGYRIDKLTPLDKTIEECDWLFLGDSYTQGAQVNYDELFTTQLFNYFPSKVIINAGVSGFGLPHCYNYFLDKGHKLKPKIVFLQICNFNDFMNLNEPNSSFLDYILQFSDLLRSFMYTSTYINPTELPMGRWVEPFYKSNKENSDYNIFYKVKSEVQIKDLNKFKIYLTKIRDAVNKAGAKLVVFQLPTKEQIYYKYFVEVVDAFSIQPSLLDMDYPNTFLAELTSSLGITYYDITEDFILCNDQVYFDYDEHLNKVGHLALANALAKRLSSNNSTLNIDYISKSNLGDRYARLSYDKNNIVFQSMRHGNSEIFYTNINFDSTRRLTYNNIDDCHPCLYGNTLAFTSGNSELGETKVLLMNISSGICENLTKVENDYGAIPDISSDGNRIIYAKWSKNGDMFTKPMIVEYNITTKSENVLVSNGFHCWRPIYSPNNVDIVFISNPFGNYDIFILNTESMSISQITNTPFDEWDPTFSKDGSKILYAAKKFGNWDLFEVDLDSNFTNQITSTLGDEWDPCYGTDNLQIFFAGEFGFNNGIFRINR